jgi:hypothetical protein
MTVQNWTVKRIVDLIAAMCAAADARVAEHAKSLLGPRTRGSTTDRGLDELPDLALDDVTDALLTTVRKPGCRYLQQIVPGMGGMLGALPYGQVSPILVRRRQGAHGPELYLDPPLAAAVPSELLTVILGPPGEYPEFADGIVYTWHPGEPLDFLKDETSQPNPYTAVKTHAG